MQANPLTLPPALYAQSGQSAIIHQPGRPPAEFVAATSKQAAATIAAALARTPGELTLKNPGGLFRVFGMEIFEGNSLIARARNTVAALRTTAALNYMVGGANG